MLKLWNGLAGLFEWRIKPQDAPPNSSPDDTYLQKVLTYVPADINAAWVTLSGVLAQAGASTPHWLSWAVFGGLLGLTPFYVCYIKTSPPGLSSSKLFYLITSCLAFVAWVFALGGPFATLHWYQPVFGSVLLVFVTLTIPVMERVFIKTSPPNGGSGTSGPMSGSGNTGGSTPPTQPPGSSGPSTK